LVLIELFYEPKEALKMTRSRRSFTAQEKAAIVMRHLVDKTPVSDLCDEFGLQPTQVYAWQKQLAMNAALAFQSPRQSIKPDDAKDRKIVALEAKIQQKNEVVAELLQEHVQLKKALGEL
jgi:transposase